MNKRILFAGGMLIVLGVLALVVQAVPGLGDDIVPMVITLGISGTFLTVYLVDREQWWALIPAYVMGAATLLYGVDTFLGGGDLMPLVAPLAVAIPFFYVYLRDHEHWWALLVGYIVSVGGVIAFISEITSFDAGVLAPLLVALPFFVVFFKDREQWWALIPGGVLASAGVGLMMEEMAALVVPAALIGLGLLLVLGGVGRSDEKPVTEQPPLTGPEADKPREPVG